MNRRLERLRARLEEEQLDGLLVSSPGEEHLGHETRRYLSGFTGSAGVLLVTANGAWIAADFRYVEQAGRECTPAGFTVVPAKGRRSEWLRELFGTARAGGKRLGVTVGDVTLAGWLGFTEAVADLPFAERPRLRAAPRIVEALRRTKEPDELAALQCAINISDKAFSEVEAAITALMTEREAAALFAERVRRNGGDDISFPTIVAAGPWGAMPHAQPRDEQIGEGRPLVFDMGARVDGYCSDLTRTIVLGREGSKFAEIYDIVYAAQQTAIEKVESGMTGQRAHRLAADVIAAAGYGEQFGHGLGHGVGLQVHESPYLGETSEDTLEDEMVFTIEPGIYIPGWGGVRIEDVVVLEAGRARVLSHARKRTPAGA